MKHKILIVGPTWVGDMVMAQCLFKLIKGRQHDAWIDVLAPAWSLPLLKRMPEVKNGIIMPFGHGELKLAERYRLGKTLRQNHYQQTIILPNSFKSALIPFFANIPLRTGWRGEMRYGVVNDMRHLNKKQYPLMIERFMALGMEAHEQLPKEYPLPELQTAANSSHQSLIKHNLPQPQAPILALCPGAEFGPAKRWPEAYFAEIANAKLKEGWDVWLFGSAKDNVVTQDIMTLTQQRCVNLAGKTSLEEAIDLLSFATGVVSNDSGLMHVASALKKPLVVVYGPTSAGFTPPLHQKAKILTTTLDCQPCFKRICPLKHHRCMLELQPQGVLQAMQEWVA